MQKPSGNLSRFFIIAIHVLIWLGLYMIPYIDDSRQHISPHFILRNTSIFVLLASFYYFNTYFLIRKLFLSGKLFYYLLAILGCLVFISGMYLLFSSIIDVYVPSEYHHPNYLHRLFLPFFPSLFVLAISMAIKITNEWFRAEKQKKEMENEKLHSELAFLKSQVNPHFLLILNSHRNFFWLVPGTESSQPESDRCVALRMIVTNPLTVGIQKTDSSQTGVDF